jgi:hypothetical protein
LEGGATTEAVYAYTLVVGHDFVRGLLNGSPRLEPVEDESLLAAIDHAGKSPSQYRSDASAMGGYGDGFCAFITLGGRKPVRSAYAFLEVPESEAWGQLVAKLTKAAESTPNRDIERSR